MHRRSRILPAALLACAAIAGCTSSDSADDPAIRAQREKLVLADEPSGAVSFANARKQIAEQSEVVLIGRIAAGDQAPWVDGQAAFFITDASAEDAEHGKSGTHDPANCPFCKRRANHPHARAIVQFVDVAGKVLPIDARQLFDVADNQIVVVEGTAKVDSLDVMYVTARGIHVRW